MGDFYDEGNRGEIAADLAMQPRRVGILEASGAAIVGNIGFGPTGNSALEELARKAKAEAEVGGMGFHHLGLARQRKPYDSEIEAIGVILHALAELHVDQLDRVIAYAEHYVRDRKKKP